MNPDIIAEVAEREIREAIEEGKFDNLPGKGKSIVFDDDPMTPPHLRMANSEDIHPREKPDTNQ